MSSGTLEDLSTPKPDMTVTRRISRRLSSRYPRRIAITLLQIGTVAAVLVLWQLGSDKGSIDVAYFSKPTAIWSYLGDWAGGRAAGGGTLAQDLEASLIVFGFGYLIGVLAGAALGILLGTTSVVREVLEPFLAVANAVPKLILMPMLLVVFGFGYEPQIILVISVIILFVTINVAAGVSETAHLLIDNATMLGAGRLQLVLHVYVPSVSIWVLSTSRVSVGYAVQASVAAQLVGGNKGLGFRVVDASASFRSDEMFAAFAVLTVLVLVVDALLSLVERRATRWMPTRSAR